MNRRQFVQAAAAGIGLGALRSQAANGPVCSFPGTPRERLAVASYPFRKDVNPKNGKLTLLEFPKMVADRFGVFGIEPLDEHFPSIDAAYLARFRAALRDAKAHVVNIPVGRLEASFYDPDAHKRQIAVDNARKWVDVAVAIGSPSIRAHILPVKGVAPNVIDGAAALKQLAAYGQEKNIVVNMENDDPASEDAFFIVELIKRVHSPWLRALPDFCNSMLFNKGDDYNYRSVEAMFQHACNISHAKELETDAGKQYRVDVAKTYAIAERAGYKGYFSIEWDSDGDPYAGTQHLIELSLKSLR